jgi:hypothetical protein
LLNLRTVKESAKPERRRNFENEQPVLHLLHTARDAVDVAVAGENHESGVGLAAGISHVLLWQVIFLWNAVLVRWFTGTAEDGIFDVRERGSPAISLVRKAENVVECDLERRRGRRSAPEDGKKGGCRAYNRAQDDEHVSHRCRHHYWGGNA